MFENLTDRLQGVFKKLRGQGKLSEDNIKDAMREVRLALLEADVNFKVAKDFINKVKERAVGEEVLKSVTPGQQVVKVVHDELVKLLGSTHSKLDYGSSPPAVFMMVGLQGSGKTTTSGKLAKQLKKEQKNPLLVAGDIYRPAAVDQLKTVGEQVGVPVFSIDGAKPQEISVAAVKHAKKEGHQVVIVDTAGRLHIDEILMEELRDLKTLLEPQEVLFIADAMTGQDAVNVAMSFNEVLDISGVILTKMDGDARGGAALSIKAMTDKPIKLIGVGEKLDLLEKFHPEGMASRILGMGDVVSLVEKAQQAIDKEEALALQEKLMRDEFTIEDFMEQLQRLRKMGPIGQLMDMLPGFMKPKGLDSAMMGVEAEEEFKYVEAIIRSMTPEERRNHQLLNSSRKKRIARGSGTTVAEVNNLVKEFVEAKNLISKMNPKAARMLKSKSKKKKKKRRKKTR